MTATPAASLLANVQQMLDQYTAFPLIGTALAPDLVGISLATMLKLTAGTASDEQSLIVSRTRQAAASATPNRPYPARRQLLATGMVGALASASRVRLARRVWR